ncbi:MAG: hypothetical protein K2X82_17940 [Gemmataceae bacterium]|nr:hypothetical protein [Gemmataceae bacterium]
MLPAVAPACVWTAIPPPGGDPRVAPLRDPAVRGDPDRLAAALRDLWDKVPPPPPRDRHWEAAKLARALVPFIALESAALKDQEAIAGLGTGRPVQTMLVRIGLPAVRPLLEELRAGPDTEEVRIRRLCVLDCLAGIYSPGGAGRQMAAERVKLYAASLHSEPAQKWVLSALDADKVQPPAPKK